MNSNILYILSGLPGVGKTTLSMKLAARIGAVYLRIDTIEQALKDLCDMNVEGEGYRLSYRIAADNLNLGLAVVADSCNTIYLTRKEWEEVAESSGAVYRNIEIICSDTNQHRSRIENRKSNIRDYKLPNWDDVMRREYHTWNKSRILIDTAGRSPDESLTELMNAPILFERMIVTVGRIQTKVTVGLGYNTSATVGCDSSNVCY